jgi:hypothetical protein
LESKGYERPLAKGQLRQLRAAIEREFEPKSPSTPEPEAGTTQGGVPTEAGRSGVEGANQKNTEPERDPDPPSGAASTPPGAADDHPPGRRPPGGTNRPTSGGAKGSRPDTPVRGRPAKPEELPGAAAGGDEPPGWER